MNSWSCPNCHSLNNRGAGRCYSCGYSASGDDVRDPFAPAPDRRVGSTATFVSPSVAVPSQTGDRQSREIDGVPSARAERRARPARLRATALVLLLAASVATTALITVMLPSAVGWLFGFAALGSSTDAGWLLVLSIGRDALWIATALAWFVWFDCVLRSCERLGAGEPASSRIGAVLWWFVPILSFVRPARAVGDAYRRLSAPGTPGNWLPAYWWLTWIGASLVPLGGSLLILVFGRAGGMTLANFLNALLGLQIISGVLEIASGLLAIRLVLAFQHSMGMRAARLAIAASAPPVQTNPDPFEAPSVGAASEPNPAGPSGWRTRISPRLAAAVAVIAAVALTGIGLQLHNSPGSPAAPTGTSSPGTSVVGPGSPGPGASAGPTEVPSASALRAAIAAPDFRGHVDLYGTITIGDKSAAISGTVDFASGDFRSDSRLDHPLGTLDQRVALIEVDGQAFVRDETGTWAAATEVPPTLAVELLDQLAPSDELSLVADPGQPATALQRFGWANGASILAHRAGDLGGARVRVKDGEVDVVVSVYGVPERVEATLHGTWIVGGKSSAFRTVLTYQFSEFGKPITIVAPSVTANPTP